MTNNIRKEIETRIKNGLDISDLIKDVDISGENLIRAKIRDFNRICDDFSNVNLTHAVIGEDGVVNDISSSIIKNALFRGTVFKGKFIARNCDFRGTVFVGASVPYIEYQNSDLRGCKFCNTIFTFGTNVGRGAILDYETVKDLFNIYQCNFKLVKEEEVWKTQWPSKQ